MVRYFLGGFWPKESLTLRTGGFGLWSGCSDAGAGMTFKSQLSILSSSTINLRGVETCVGIQLEHNEGLNGPCTGS